MPSRTDDLKAAKLRLFQPSVADKNGSHPELAAAIPASDGSELRANFAEYKELLRKHLVIDDWQGVEIIVAAAVSHYVPATEMLWMRVIGASRAGKTEMIRPFEDHVDTEMLGVMTPASIKGGFRNGPSLVERIHGQLVLTEDLAAILTLKNDTRTQLFGLLRSLKDGKIDSDFNSSAGHVSVKARFDWIACTTHGFEHHRSLEAQLGQRFVDLVYRWKPSSGIEMAVQAQKNNASLTDIRADLSERAHAVLDGASVAAKGPAPKLDTYSIARLAFAAAKARTPVERDGYSKRIEHISHQEAPTSLAQDFNRIAQGLSLLGITDYKPYLRRMAWDCMPSIRAKVMRLLMQDAFSQSDLARRTGLSDDTIRYELESMRVLRLVNAKNELNSDSIGEMLDG